MARTKSQPQLARGALLSLFLTCIVAAGHSELPDGKGKDLVENSCADCHSLDRIMAQRLDQEGWNGTIREMIENGAAINPNDMKAIVDYLAKNFGPDKKVNINKAGGEEIGGVLKLTPAEATAIVQYRTQHGSFKDLSELEKVSGLTEKIEAKKALIEF
jgi:competence ComEA-like helix-hairpin-helix protein